MNSEIMKQEDNKITLKLVIGPEQFEDAINKAYNKLKGRFNIPGFRKGKAPRKIIEVQYGKEVFYEEAINICLPEIYETALELHKIDPVDRPEIDIEEIKKDQDIMVTATVEVMPEIEVDNYKGIEVEKKEYNVQEEDVQKELDAMLEKNARMIDVNDRPVKDQDTVIMDYKGFSDGVAFEGGTAEKQSLVIGSGRFIPGFEDQLIGVNIGEEVNVQVTFPEEYHSEDLAGKEATFEVTIHEIKEKEIPALDDEFAKDVSEFDTLEELKQDIRTKLEDAAIKRAEEQVKNDVIESIVDSVNVDIPNPVIERQIDGMVRDFSYQLSYQGLNLDYYYQMTGTDENSLRDQMRSDAESRVKTQLVLEKISQLEEIKATEEELETEMQKLAEQYKQDIEQFKSNLREADINYFKENIVIRKTIDFLLDHAKIA